LRWQPRRVSQRFAIYRGWVKVRKGDVVEGLSL